MRKRSRIMPSARLVEIKVPREALALIRSQGAKGIRAFEMGPCRILVNRNSFEPGSALEWHLSISCHDRYPTWDEIADARDKLLPGDETFGMILPPRESYVNVHEYCFHLHRLPDQFGS